MIPRVSTVFTFALAFAAYWFGTHPPQEIVSKERVDAEPASVADVPPAFVHMLGTTTAIRADSGRFDHRGPALCAEDCPLWFSAWPDGGGLLVVWPGLGLVAIPEDVPEAGILLHMLETSLPPNQIEDPESLHYVTVEEWEAAGAKGAR